MAADSRVDQVKFKPQNAGTWRITVAGRILLHLQVGARSAFGYCGADECRYGQAGYR